MVRPMVSSRLLDSSLKVSTSYLIKSTLRHRHLIIISSYHLIIIIIITTARATALCYTYSVCNRRTNSQLSVSTVSIELFDSDKVCKLVRLYSQLFDIVVISLLSNSLERMKQSKIKRLIIVPNCQFISSRAQRNKT